MQKVSEESKQRRPSELSSAGPIAGSSGLSLTDRLCQAIELVSLISDATSEGAVAVACRTVRGAALARGRGTGPPLPGDVAGFLGEARPFLTSSNQQSHQGIGRSYRVLDSLRFLSFE